MNLIFTRDLKAELADLEQVFKHSLLPWWDNIDNYVNRLKNDFTWTILPPVVMSIYKYTGHNRQLSIAMSNIFRNCYLAHRIHALVKDDEEGQQHDQELQFSILIGDYLFGYVLKALVDTRADSQVDDFTQMIAEVNQGMLVKHKLNGSCEEVAEKTRAPFYATAFLTAAQLAGYDRETCKVYHNMGFHFGMSVELGQDPSLKQQAQFHVHECEKLFIKLNQRDNIANSNLERAIRDLHCHFCDLGEFAVV
ncbi:hypothetical protein [Syntrophomonas curvata]